MNSAQVTQQLQEEIEDATSDLSDVEYLDVLEGIRSYCQSCLTAKRQELDKG